MTSTVSAAPDLEVPFHRFATFIRQVTHDVRNNLNAMDLQAAYAAEIITDSEAAEEVRRIRQLVQLATKQLQALSANFQVGQPSPVSYAADIFVEDLRDRLAKMFPEQAPEVEWKVKLGADNISVDLEMIFAAIAEVIRNAFQFREPGKKVRANGFADENRMVLEVIEEKASVPSDPANWGREPFVSTRRGGYGLGLFRARRILEIHGGELVATYDPLTTRLITRISLPLAT